MHGNFMPPPRYPNNYGNGSQGPQARPDHQNAHLNFNSNGSSQFMFSPKQASFPRGGTGDTNDSFASGSYK